MLKTFVASPLTRVLIIESWLYLGLRWELTLLNLGTVLFALLVLNIRLLQRTFFEMVLVFLCPIVFYYNSRFDLAYQYISFLYLGLMVLALKNASTSKTRGLRPYVVSENHNEYRHEIPERSALNLRSRTELKTIDDSLSEIYQRQGKKKSSPQTSKPFGFRLPKAAFLLILTGFVIGYLRIPSPRIGLSFQDGEEEYYSYLNPLQSSVDLRKELYPDLQPAAFKHQDISWLKLFTFRTFEEIEVAVASFFYELDDDQLPQIKVNVGSGEEETTKQQ